MVHTFELSLYFVLQESVSETKRPRLSPGKNFVEPLPPRETRTTRRNKMELDPEPQAASPRPDITVLAADTEVLSPGYFLPNILRLCYVLVYVTTQIVFQSKALFTINTRVVICF